MGYFSNGTEGQMYVDEYCSKCIHYDNCPIWAAHLIYNYDVVAMPEKESPGKAILNMLIPRSAEGFNEKCNMIIYA